VIEETVLKKVHMIDLEPIKYSLIKGDGGPKWAARTATEVGVWYRRFLFLCAVYPDECLVPSEAIDNFWHVHILDSLKYHEDCEYLFGYYTPTPRESEEPPCQTARSGFYRTDDTAPGTEIAAMERREAPAFSKRERGKTEDWCAAWRSIPSFFGGG
jgi:hypothetical protein